MRKSLATVATVMILCAGAAGASEIVAPEDFPVAGAYAAMGAGDIPAAVSYLTEDAVFAVVPAPQEWGTPALVGRKAIGEWWTFLAGDNSTLEVVNLKLDDNRATFQAHFHGDFFRAQGIDPVVLDGVAILQDNKISGLMFR